MVVRYRKKLRAAKYTIEGRSPFVDYRPDIYATKNNSKLFVEVEIEQTLKSEHTLGQLEKMQKYTAKSKHYHGIVVVPASIKRFAQFMIRTIFEGDRMEVVSL
jgi:hypothetical protein